MELADSLVLGKVMRVGVGKEDVHVELEAAVRDAGLQGRGEGAGVEGYQHFRTPAKCENSIKSTW